MIVEVPDLGDFTDVPVIELLVAPGDRVAVEDPLVVLESDKATMEIPSPSAGVVEELLVAVGDTVQKGTPLARLTTDAETTDVAPAESAPAPAAEVSGAPDSARVDLVVLGAGPGGYTAAFRAADLGLEVVLVERDERLGGVCLNIGCIPSKALLHVAKVLTDAEASAEHGVRFGTPEIDLDGVRAFKDGAVAKLTGGLDGLARGRKVRVVRGEARFAGPDVLTVGDEEIAFAHCIVAAGSTPATLPGLPDDPRIVDSTGALALDDVPARLLVVGGGIIGLEMATVYDALGAQVTVVELADQLIPGCDADLVEPLHARIAGRYAAIHLGKLVQGVEAREDGLVATLSDGTSEAFDRVLVAVGRWPNGGGLGLERAGVAVDERGYIPVDAAQRTNVPSILAIGDVVGEPMLAHKASHEGKVAAEVVAGRNVVFDARAIPSVAYTDPEIAWAGLTETRARTEDIPYEVARFPWTASGRALTTGRTDGLTKLLYDPESRRVLGAGIAGPSAGELIAEAVLAIEMGADVEDVGLAVHAHPTLSETVAFAAEVGAGTITDLPPARRRR